MGMALGAGRREGPPPMACCPCCPGEVPLISTMLFAGAEFYCLECGAQVGFVNPKPVVETPELAKRYGALKAEWDQNVVPLKGDRDAQIAWLRDRVSREQR
jgi:hypothetical protein